MVTDVDVRAGLERLAERLGGAGARGTEAPGPPGGAATGARGFSPHAGGGRGAGARVTEAQRLSGGASMETWAFSLDGGGGPERLILRRRSVPFDPDNARSIPLATEAALIRATGANGARAPKVRHVCDEADGL